MSNFDPEQLRAHMHNAIEEDAETRDEPVRHVNPVVTMIVIAILGWITFFSILGAMQ